MVHGRGCVSPYIGSGDPDGGFESVMTGFINRSADYGDWLGVYVSEMGWSSVTGTSVTEERIGEYHKKVRCSLSTGQ